MAKTVAVISASGFLGAKMAKGFEKAGFKVFPTFFSKEGNGTELDVTNAAAVNAFFKETKPDIVVNCSALTRVDWCEEHKEQCFKVNAEGVKNLAVGCKKSKTKLVHFSTAFVFDGKKESPYIEEDTLNPLNVYSESKAESEKAVREGLEDFLIIRTVDLYGFNKPGEKNFVTWVLENLKTGKEFGVVNDQFSQPALIDDLVSATLKLVELDKKGVFHVFGPEYLSKYDFAVKAAKAFGFGSSKIKPISTKGSPLKAARPMTLKTSNEKVLSLGVKLHNIDEGLAIMQKQIGQENF